jgi:hypothetical protein
VIGTKSTTFDNTSPDVELLRSTAQHPRGCRGVGSDLAVAARPRSCWHDEPTRAHRPLSKVEARSNRSRASCSNLGGTRHSFLLSTE